MILTPEKYLSKAELRVLRNRTEEKAIVDKAKGRTTWVKIWMLIDLVTGTGMRVSELRKLKVNQINLGHEPFVHVENGKGGRSRNILISNRLKKQIKDYIFRFDLNATDYLLNVKGKPYTNMGLQQQFKNAIKNAELSKDYSIHAARHTYGTYLYAKTKDLRMVQKQLGHSSPATTVIYADATKESTYKAVNGLYDVEDE